MKKLAEMIKGKVAAIALAAGLSAAFALPTAAQAAEALEASVGYYAGALISLPALVAKDKKFFEKNALNVRNLDI